MNDPKCKQPDIDWNQEALSIEEEPQCYDYEDE